MSGSYQLRKCVATYRTWGDNGLKRSRSRKLYSFKEMISVVESYLTSEISYQKLALQVGINNPALLARWVYEYKTAGSDALRSHRKGRKKLNTTKSGNNGIQEVQNTEIDTRVEHVKELEDELLKRRIKNAFVNVPPPIEAGVRSHQSNINDKKPLAMNFISTAKGFNL